MFIDESGDEGFIANREASFDVDWFTTGGIIVKEEDVSKFEEVHSSIMKRCFPDPKIIPPSNFKLHYHDLRQNIYPYDKMTREKRISIADDMFNAINSIDCRLVSATIFKPSLKEKYNWPVSVRAYTLLRCLERFQYFLNDQKSIGNVIYERLNTVLRKRMGREMHLLRKVDASSFTNLSRIKGNIINGDPTKEKILQFADFFVYTPHIKMATNDKSDDRWNEIRDKYYLLGGSPEKSGFVTS